MESLKQLRKDRGFTQEQLANLFGVSRRTYQRYEENETEQSKKKLREMIFKILNLQVISETTGVLSVNEITQKVRNICKTHSEIECVYLFGSYARGEMTEKSDVDLFYVGNKLTGLNVAGFYGELCRSLCKEVDLLSPNSIVGDENMISEATSKAFNAVWVSSRVFCRLSTLSDCFV